MTAISGVLPIIPPDEFADTIVWAGQILISAVRGTEDDEEGKPLTGAELTLQVETTGGGTETWIIAIEHVESKQ